MRINAKLRFTTMIILPEQEEILDFVCGDKEFWIVSGAQNLAYVKPAKAGATTNLNLVTASGDVYSFLLTEGGADPDLKLYVTPDDTMKVAAAGPKKFYASAQVDDLRRAAEEARNEVDAARKEDAAGRRPQTSIDERVNEFRCVVSDAAAVPVSLQGRTRSRSTSPRSTRTGSSPTSARTRPSCRRSMKCATARRTSSTFQVEHGVYIVPKVLDSGYLVIGKQKLVFQRAVKEVHHGTSNNNATNGDPARRQFRTIARSRAACCRDNSRCG